MFSFYLQCTRVFCFISALWTNKLTISSKISKLSSSGTPWSGHPSHFHKKKRELKHKEQLHTSQKVLKNFLRFFNEIFHPKKMKHNHQFYCI